MKLIVKCTNFFSKYFYLFLAALLIVGFFLRIYHLWDNIIFAFDQGRDATRILGIITLKHFKIVGPETDIPGIFNGPLFYYILAPFYLLFKLNPNGPALEIAIISSTSALVVFYAGKVLFNKYVGFLASIFWTFSFEQIAYSHYISNSSFMGVSSALFFLGCALFFLKKRETGLLISAAGLGLAVNFNFYLIYLFGFYLIFFILFPRKILWKTICFSLLILFILLSPFLISQIQFHFIGIKSLVLYLSKQSPESKSLSTLGGDISLYVKRLTDAVFYSYFSFSRILAILILLLSLVFVYFKSKEKKNVYFLYAWIFSTFPLFAFHSGVLTVQVINSSLQGGFAILVAVTIWYLLQSKKTLFLGIFIPILIIISNIYLLQKVNFIPNKFFVSEPMNIGEQKQVIDYTYKKAGGRRFSICGVTNPLLVNTVWGYLYNWYGKSKYGYLPLWAGIKQDLFPNLLQNDTNHVPLRFFIQEPLVGIPPTIAKAMVFMEDNTSTLLGEKKFGGIIVQERMLQPQPRKFIDTQNLTSQEAQGLKSLTTTTPLYSCYNTY